MAAVPKKAEKAGKSPSLEDKARLLVSRLRELATERNRLRRRAEEQEARLAELNRRLAEVEESRHEAKRRLRKLANQLPGG